MSRIILVLLLASLGCGCSAQVSDPAASGSESLPLPAQDCLCPVCVGPQYPVAARAPICLGRVEFWACYCQPQGTAQASCFAHPPMGATDSDVCESGPNGTACCSYTDASGHCEATYFDGQNETKAVCGHIASAE